MVFCKDCKHVYKASSRILHFYMTVYHPYYCNHPSCFVEEEPNVASGEQPKVRVKDITDLNYEYNCGYYEKKSPWWKFWA